MGVLYYLHNELQVRRDTIINLLLVTRLRRFTTLNGKQVGLSNGDLRLTRHHRASTCGDYHRASRLLIPKLRCLEATSIVTRLLRGTITLLRGAIVLRRRVMMCEIHLNGLRVGRTTPRHELTLSRLRILQ